MKNGTEKADPRKEAGKQGPSPAGDILAAGLFEEEMQAGGPARFLWKFHARWESVLDAAERAYRAMGADRQLAALPAVRAVLRENAPLCARRLELARNEPEPGQAFEIWCEDSEERMAVPGEDLFYPDEPGLVAKRAAYLGSDRPTA